MKKRPPPVRFVVRDDALSIELPVAYIEYGVDWMNDLFAQHGGRYRYELTDPKAFFVYFSRWLARKRRPVEYDALRELECAMTEAIEVAINRKAKAGLTRRRRV